MLTRVETGTLENADPRRRAQSLDPMTAVVALVVAEMLVGVVFMIRRGGSHRLY